SLNMKGILFASIIVGGLGVLDDITVSQVSLIGQLHSANKRLGWRELYKRSMKVGRDHIASLVNTLVIAYAGASMPLVMLLSINSSGISGLINDELIAEEIVRTIVASMGLVLM